MSVTFVASGNATLAASTTFATCSIGGVNYEAILLSDTAGSILGVAGNPLQVSGTFSACVASLISGSVTIVNNSATCVLYTSACITNMAGSAAGSPLFASITNSPSVIINSGSIVVTNQVSASISNVASVIVSSGSLVVTAGSTIITNSPSVVVSSGSLVVTAGSVIVNSDVASPVFSRLSDGTDTAAIDSASRLLVSASLTDGLTVTSASVTVVNNGTASPVFAKLTDGTDTVAVDSASRLLVSASLTDGLSVTAASVTIVNNSTACVLYTSACITNFAGSAAGSPLFASITNSPSVIVSSGSAVITSGSVIVNTAVASPLLSRLTDGTDTVAVDAASRLLVSASLTDGLSVTAASVTVVNNSTACVLYASACITNLAGSAAGSPLFTSVTNVASVIVSSGSVVVTNGLSASISGGSVALLAGANVIGSASVIQSGTWAVTASIANSPSVAVTNLAGSAAGSPLFVSACITNLSGSASGSPLFASITNVVSASISSGSVAILTGANVIGSASVIQSTAGAITAPWPVKLSDGTDSVIVDAASRLGVTVTDGTNAFGLPASPMSMTGQGQTMYWAGSTLTIKQIDLSSSISGCTPIVASTAGIAIVILNATFTTSGCQRIGWTACGNNGGASAAIQTPMPFGTNGGMDAKRSPDSYLWAFPSGSIAVLTTTSACYVAGTINYISVAS